MVRDRSSELSPDTALPDVDSDETAEVTSTVSSGVNGWIMAGITGGVAALIWFTVLSGGEGPDQQIVDAADQAGDASGAQAAAEDSTVPGAAVRYVDETPTTIPVPTTASNSQVLIAPTTSPPSTLPAGTYLLGEQTDLWLFYGGDDPLQRLDLDNGELLEVGIRAVPVAVTGQELVVFQTVSALFGWVLAEDPGEQAAAWRKGPIALGVEPGALWLLDKEQDTAHPAGVPAGSGQWELVDIEAGQVLERRPGDRYEEVEAADKRRAERGRDPWRPHPAPDLTQRPDGIHRYRSDGYQLLRSGWVLTSDDQRALIEVCDQAETCRYEWMSLPSGGLLDVPVPVGNVVDAELIARGGWLRWSEPDGRLRFLELATGEELQFPPGRQVELSPGGRWLATFNEAVLEIYELATLSGPTPEPTAELEVLNRQDGGRLLFAEQTD